MSLGYPVTPSPSIRESQQFGPAFIFAAGYWSQPAMYATGTTAAWWQPYKGWPRFAHYHNGLDVAGELGTPLLALQTGRVTEAGWRTNGGGLVIEVEIRPGVRYTFNHCSALLVDAGRPVLKGQVIARIGQTGVATGNHCHISLDIAELGSEGWTRTLMWNPKLFMAGGAYASDTRVSPLSLPDTSTPPSTKYPDIEVDPMGVRFRDEDTTAVIRGGKPYRTKPTVSQAPDGTYPTTQSIHLIGRQDPTGSYDTWHLTKVYVGNGYAFRWVTSVDFQR